MNQKGILLAVCLWSFSSLSFAQDASEVIDSVLDSEWNVDSDRVLNDEIWQDNQDVVMPFSLFDRAIVAAQQSDLPVFKQVLIEIVGRNKRLTQYEQNQLFEQLFVDANAQNDPWQDMGEIERQKALQSMRLNIPIREQMLQTLTSYGFKADFDDKSSQRFWANLSIDGTLPMLSVIKNKQPFTEYWQDLNSILSWKQDREGALLVDPEERGELVAQILANFSAKEVQDYDERYDANDSNYSNRAVPFLLLTTSSQNLINQLHRLGLLTPKNKQDDWMAAAVVGGNLPAIDYLQLHLPRWIQTQIDGRYDEEPKTINKDTWLEALMYAMDLPDLAKVKQITDKLYRPDMALQHVQLQPLPQEQYSYAPANFMLAQGLFEEPSSLLAYALAGNQLTFAEKLIKDGAVLTANEQQLVLAVAISQQQTAVVDLLIETYPDVVRNSFFRETVQLNGNEVYYRDWSRFLFNQNALALSVLLGNATTKQQIVSAVSLDDIAHIQVKNASNPVVDLYLATIPDRDDSHIMAQIHQRESEAYHLELAQALMAMGIRPEKQNIGILLSALNQQYFSVLDYLLSQGVGQVDNSDAMMTYFAVLRGLLKGNQIALAQKLVNLQTWPQAKAFPLSLMNEKREVQLDLLASLMADPKASKEAIAFAQRLTLKKQPQYCVVPLFNESSEQVPDLLANTEQFLVQGLDVSAPCEWPMGQKQCQLFFIGWYCNHWVFTMSPLWGYKNNKPLLC